MTIVRDNTKSKSSLFLLELTIAIVFFALAAVICIQLFVKAHMLSRESSELNMALLQAQSVAEAYKSVHGDGEKLARVLEATVDETNGVRYSYFLLFDSNWERVTDKREAAYMLILSSENGRQMRSASIGVFPLAEGTDVLHAVYVLNVKAYTGLGAA